MRKFKDLALKNKILAGYLIVILFFIFLAVYFIRDTYKISNASRDIELHYFSGIEITNNMEVTFHDLVGFDREITSYLHEKQALAQLKEEVTETSQKFLIQVADLKDVYSNHPKLVSSIDKLQQIFNHYLDKLESEIKAQDNGEMVLDKNAVDVAQNISNSIIELRDNDIAGLSVALGSIDKFAMSLRKIYLIILIICILCSLFISFFIAKIITRPVNSLLLAQRKVGEGELDYEIKVESNDEIGLLQKGFLEMSKRINSLYKELKGERNELEQKVKERTRDLEKSQEYMQNITDGIKEGIMLLSPDFKILWANRNVLNENKISFKDIQGKFCYKVTHNVNSPCNDKDNICPLVEAMKNKGMAKELHVHYNAAGEKIFVEVICYPLFDTEGKIKEIIHISRDVTEEIITENKMQSYIVELEKTKEQLSMKLRELENFGKLAVDREIKMIELKTKIKDMEARLNNLNNNRESA